MLTISRVSKSFAGRILFEEASLQVNTGDRIGLIGPNGAGKTTLIRAASGLIGLYGGSIAGGRVLFEGRDLTRMGADRIVRLGMAQVPEGRLVFKTLSVEENLMVGAAVLPRGRRAARLDSIYDLFPRLAERKGQLAGLMSGGEQQMIAVGRALASEPRLILIDELSLGLAPLITRAIYEQLRIIVASTGTAMLVVEQNAHLALHYCDEAYVLERGQIALSGTAKELASNEQVLKAYLGLTADV